MVKLNEAVKPAENPLSNFMVVRSSKDTVLERFRITLVGPPKEGKTFTAATASDLYPDKLPCKPLVELEDMFWCLLDNGGLDGFAEQGISVPHMDLSNIPAAFIQQGMSTFFMQARERIAAGQTKTVVIDSLTALDKLLLSRLMKDYEKWGLYQALLAEHLKVFQEAKALPCNVVFICHGKYVMPTDDPDMQGRQNASGVTARTIELNLSGQVADFYRQSMSLILPVADRNVSGAREWFVYPHGAKGFAGYSRFSGLDKEEPANLKKLFAKIKQNQAGMSPVGQ